MPRAIAIDRDREDMGGFAANIEEASVEIVRRPGPGMPIPPPPRVTLAAAIAQVQESAQADMTGQKGPRTATPIGRFLKALTGT